MRGPVLRALWDSFNENADQFRRSMLEGLKLNPLDLATLEAALRELPN